MHRTCRSSLKQEAEQCPASNASRLSPCYASCLSSRPAPSNLGKYLASRRVADAVSRIKAKGGKIHLEWPDNGEYVEAVFIGPQFTDEDVELLKYFPALRVVGFIR